MTTRNIRFRNVEKRNKYGAISSTCTHGHRHPSKLEAKYCFYLTMLVKNKDIYAFEYERRFELRVNGILICHHKPDFCVYKTKEDHEADHFEIHETKGVETMDWKLRRNLMEALFPNSTYYVIK